MSALNQQVFLTLCHCRNGLHGHLSGRAGEAQATQREAVYANIAAASCSTVFRTLILYGSVRERSYSRFAAEEAGRLLTSMGAEVRVYNPSIKKSCEILYQLPFPLLYSHKFSSMSHYAFFSVIENL